MLQLQEQIEQDTGILTGPLTVLSYGAGQDSTALLYKIVYDPEFRAQYVAGHLLVVCSDTGDEHPETYQHIEDTKDFCAQHGIEFVHITNDMGFHPPKWGSLREQYNANKSVGSKCYVKSCTDNLKLKPIYDFLDHYVGEKWGYGHAKRGKKNLKQLAAEHGKIRVILGIAAGEDGRAGPNYTVEQYREFQAIRKVQAAERKRCKEAGLPKPKFEEKAPDLKKWMVESIEKVYPLIDLGLDRQGCQDYIASTGHPVPPPSNCMLCPFMSEQELLWLYHHYREDYHDWVRIEANKIEEHARRGTPVDKNFGVWGRKLLPEKLQEAMQKYGHMTIEELNEYKMSHGHCVKSQY